MGSDASGCKPQSNDSKLTSGEMLVDNDGCDEIIDLKNIEGSTIEQREDLIDDISAVWSSDDEEGGVEGASPAEVLKERKKRKHTPMSADEQIASIAALKQKLLDFPPSEPNSFGYTPAEKKLMTKPSPLANDVHNLSNMEIAQLSPKKRKRTPKPKTRPLKQPRPRKQNKKSIIAAFKLPTITPATQALLDLLSQMSAGPRIIDVQKIVDQAGDILDVGSNGETLDEEIKALLEQEEGWKLMASQGDGSLKETVKKFMERYGIIPIGALEVAESKLAAMGS